MVLSLQTYDQRLLVALWFLDFMEKRTVGRMVARLEGLLRVTSVSGEEAKESVEGS
jgi:hypothetical protein